MVISIVSSGQKDRLADRDEQLAAIDEAGPLGF
jgi:hypothetical protein